MSHYIIWNCCSVIHHKGKLLQWIARVSLIKPFINLGVQNRISDELIFTIPFVQFDFALSAIVAPITVEFLLVLYSIQYSMRVR